MLLSRSQAWLSIAVQSLTEAVERSKNKFKPLRCGQWLTLASAGLLSKEHIRNRSNLLSLCKDRSQSMHISMTQSNCASSRTSVPTSRAYCNKRAYLLLVLTLTQRPVRVHRGASCGCTRLFSIRSRLADVHQYAEKRASNDTMDCRLLELTKVE